MGVGVWRLGSRPLAFGIYISCLLRAAGNLALWGETAAWRWRYDS
jgi:hypothetical protein